MESSKVYVNVMAEFTADGRLLPRSFIWKEGHVYEIQKVTDVRRAASLKAGGAGMRYTCIVDGRESHLYYEDNNMSRWLNRQTGQRLQIMESGITVNPYRRPLQARVCKRAGFSKELSGACKTEI